MKLPLAALLSLVALTSAHSWLDCVDTDTPNYEEAKKNPATVLPKNICRGYPRNKHQHTQWVEESTNYAWKLDHPDRNPNGLACNPKQTNTYPGDRPMTKAKPGAKLRLLMWGNGHARPDWGLPKNTDPGVVRLYWKGEREKEIEKRDELTEANWMKGQQAKFSADSWSVKLPDGRPDDKANYFHVKLPDKIENGRHMFVWVWAGERGLVQNKEGWKEGDYDRRWNNVWSTCFDIMIEGSDHKGASIDKDAQKKLEKDLKEQKNPMCQDKSCRKGGNAAATCQEDKDPKTKTICPPCWYKKGEDIDCYEYKDGKCPFGGAYDCAKNEPA